MSGSDSSRSGPVGQLDMPTKQELDSLPMIARRSGWVAKESGNFVNFGDFAEHSIVQMKENIKDAESGDWMMPKITTTIDIEIFVLSVFMIVCDMVASLSDGSLT